MRFGIAGMTIGILASLVTSSVFAEELSLSPAATLSKVQVQAGPNYGTDNLDFGVGVRAGYTFPFGVYVGGLFDYFFESTQSQSIPGMKMTLKGTAWNVGGEVGYDFGVGRVLLRPFLGLGSTQVSVSNCIETTDGNTCLSASADDAFIQLGGLVRYVGDTFFAGGDLRMLAVDNTALVVGGHAGMAF